MVKINILNIIIETDEKMTALDLGPVIFTISYGQY